MPDIDIGTRTNRRLTQPQPHPPPLYLLTVLLHTVHTTTTSVYSSTLQYTTVYDYIWVVVRHMFIFLKRLTLILEPHGGGQHDTSRFLHYIL